MASQNTYTTAPDSNYPRRFPFTFPSLDSSEVYVSVAGTDKTVGASNDYTVGNYNKTSGGYIEFVSDTTRGTGTVRVYRLTNGSLLKIDFQAGSAIKADDLNTANKQAIYLAEETRQEFTNLASTGTTSGFAIDGSNIAPNSITSSKILDLQVKAADLSSHTSNDTERAVTTNHIRDNAVTTPKIANDAITTDKLDNFLDSAITANTAKVTNATHTGDVTGSTALTIADGAVTQAKINSAVIFTPVGTVIWFAGIKPPVGYLKCDGRAINNGNTTFTDEYIDNTTIGTIDTSALYAIVSANVPDLRGEFIRGWDDGKGIDSGRGMRTFQSDQWKNHQHVFGGDDMINSSSIGNFTSIGSSGNFQYDATSNPTGNGRSMYTKNSPIDSGGTETRPRNVSLLACIKY